MKELMQEATQGTTEALKTEAKTIEYTTGVNPPVFEPQPVYDLTDPEQPREWLERNKTKAQKEQDKALAQASVRMLFSTDISKLDDAGVKGLYQSVTEGVWGMPDSEGAFFGKRGSKDDFRRNVELLRAFFKGNYALAEDEEAQRFRKMDWAEKFKYAREHESAGNALASIAGGERGASLGELVYLSAVAGSEGTMLPPPGGDPNKDATKEISRKINYDTMTPEEKHQYEADVIGDYERKLAKREPLFTYVRMAADLSDEGAYILAKSYNENELDVPAILNLPEDEQAKVMTTYAQMKGDLQEGKLLWLIPTDFSTGTAGDRLQMGVYGLQQSVVSLGTDLYHLAEAGTMRLYAQMALGGKKRSDFYRTWNAIERAKLYEKQNLPEADTFIGKAYQSFMENVHWIIPYGGAGKLAKWGKGANAAIHAADLSKELKTAGKLADLKQMMNVSLFSRMSPMADGMKYADETLNRLLTSVDKYTRELQELDRMRLAYGAGKGALDAAWVTARGSAFAAFAQEYLETADAAGISREESVLTAVWVGLLNDRIEQLYVPGLESTLTKGQLKSLGMTALRRSFQEGTFGEYAKNFMTRYLTEGVRVGVTEGWIEEPLQQLVIEHGKQVDQVEGLDEKLKALLKPSAKDVQTYLETAVEMLPASVGFGVTTVPGQLMRRRIRNRWNARKTGLVNYDEGIVGLYQREIDVKKLIEASWQGKGEEEAEKQDKAAQPEKPSIAGRKPKKGKRGISGAIRAAAKRGEEAQPVEEPEAQPEEPQLSEEQTEEQADLQADYRATDALTRAREIHEAHQGGDVCAEIAQELGLDVKTAEAVVQLLDEEAEVMRFDPRARSMVDQFFAGVRINEDTIATLLPGYVAGSFEADEENGVYVAKVKVGEDGGIAGGVKTIVYRRRDGVFFNPDGTLNEAELARAASRNSTLGKSYNQRIEQSGGNGLRWEELSDADRRREALILVNGRTDMAGAIAFRKKDGSEVTVRADAIINLATGRLADIGYGMGAKQATVRHETFHALWRFARELVKPEELKKIADALAIDTKQEGWEDALDEKMAHQMEQYASGHYVINAVSSRFEAFQAWAAKIFGGVDANRVLDTLPKDRQTQLGTILGEGTPFALEPFYNAVMQGKIGSGEMGIDKIVVPAKQEKQTAKEEDELPVEGAKEEPKPEEKPEPAPEEKPDEPKPEAKPAGNTMTRPSWDKGTHVVKRVERKDYKLKCRLEVVNVFDGVRTSWDADFDQANQGREMDDQKVAEIAGNLDYSKGGRVMEFTGKGAMLVAPNMNVLDGNHHTQGIRQGYRQGGEKAEKFREDCLAEARERGLEVSDHAAEAPVIVCIIESVETEEGKPTPTIAEIASDTNETSQEELTSFAKAMKYAQVLIKKDLIPRFKIDPETGDIMDEDAKTVKDGMRADPVGIFVQETHAKDIVKNDRLTEQGQEILRASIIAALLGDTDAETVKNMLARQKTLDMENEQRALMRMAPGLMALVNDPAKKDYDLRPDLVEALLWYQEWRDHDEEARRKAGKTKADWRAKKPDGSLKEPAALGTTWENYKGDLFSKPGPAAQIIGDLFAAAQAQRSFKQDGETDTKAGMKRAQELIVRELEAYLENVYATNTDTNDMFGDFTPPTKDQILTTQREKNARYSVALYHGTGADFREPSLAHVGEGTGVAAQGHGFYVSDDRSWADFMGHQAQNAGIIDSLIGRRYVYQYEYDGDTENLVHWVGPNPEAAERLMKTAKDAGLAVRESFFADPDHTTGQRMERFLELAKRPDGSKLTRTEMGELFVKAGIDGVQEYVGQGMGNTYVFYNVGKLKNVHKWHGKKQLYSVAYKPRPIAPEKVAEIVEKFGVTDNIEESLWILPDGRMLKGEKHTYDLGGRKVHSFGHDALTPYVVGEVKKGESAGVRVANAMRDIYATGFIRITADSSGLYIAKRPTDEQFDALYDICDKAYQRMEADGLDEMFVDVEDENFRTAFTVRYRRGTSARRMIEDLKAWYDDGVMPDGATSPRYSIGRLYTGSAADYDKPSIRKVGTGEGSTVYGWGLYASDRRGIAEGYAEGDSYRKTEPLRALWKGKASYAFPRASKEWDALRGLTKYGSVDATIAEIERTYGDMEYAQEVKKWIEDHRSEITYTQPASRNVYEQTWWTNREPGDESHLIEWHEPVSEENLKRVADEFNREFPDPHMRMEVRNGDLCNHWDEEARREQTGLEEYSYWGMRTGGQLYSKLSRSPLFGSDKAVSEFLARAGVDGVKYPADSFGKSLKDGREAGWNYVAFSDKHLRVDHKWRNGQQLYSVGPLYTGSGANYDSPDIRKVGSGEGNQVFGWGLYATNRKYIAEDYAKQRAVEYGARIYLKGREIKADGLGTEAEKFALEWLANSAESVDAYGGPKGYALALAESLEANASAYRKSSKFFEEAHARKYEDAAKWLRDNADDFAVRPEGARMLYEQTWWTNREPGDESHLLEWYEPVDGKTVKTILDKLRKETPIDIRISDLPSGAWQFSAMKKTPWGKMPDPLGAHFSDELTARDLYRLIADAVGPQAASESLYKIGIDGIKYPANSFGLGKTDGEKYGWNYVAFSDENLRIDHKWEDGEQRYSSALHRAKRDWILRPKSAIPQMEFDFHAERTGIIEPPKAEPKAEPPKGGEPAEEQPKPTGAGKKGKRYRQAVEDANGYQDFIDRYRPLFEAAIRRGDWKPVLDFADENKMQTASNVLKQYYRDPEFSRELVGTKVASVEDAAAILMTVRSPFVESTKAIYLDRHRKILDAKILTIGKANEATIGAGTITRNMPPKTAYVVFSHNHPSGDPKPSGPDKDTTMTIKKELKRSNVKLLDHIITDGDSYYSFNHQATLPVEVSRPKWEVLPAGTSRQLRSALDTVGYVAAHLRDDGDCGHVIYLSSQLGVVGVRRIPSIEQAKGDYVSWAQKASEGAESVGAFQALVDLGPVAPSKNEMHEVLGLLGPNFGYKGIRIVDALVGSSARGSLRSLRQEDFDDWDHIAPSAEEVNNEDRFNYPRYSIASRRIDWEKEPDSLDRVVLSTTVSHLTGQDKYPQKYLYFKGFRDRGLIDKVKPEVEKWAAEKETHWFGTYLLAKYYGDLEAAKQIARHHMQHKKVSAIADFLKKMEPADGGGKVSEPQPVRWLYVRNNDGKVTNRIPEAYAGLLAETFGGVVENGIVKVSDERNTGAKIRYRVGREFQFSGEPVKDAPYVIVDDVWTTGQTAVSLMEYLEKKGATVAAITTLAVASNGSRIKPTGNLIAGVLKKAKVDSVERAIEITGVDLRRATGSELQAYIVKGKRGAFGLESWFGSAAPVLALDFKNRKVRALRFDLFEHLTAEQRKHISTKPSQGVFAFSTAFPHLSEMGDDQLIAVAHAVKVATKYLGRKMTLPNYDAIMRDVRKAYPALTDEDARIKTMTVQGDAVKLARKIREGLEKGVSESAILKALNDSMKPTFMGEMRNEARAGVKAGAYGAHAEDMLDRRLANTFDRAIRVQAGVDTDLFEEWAGVDFTETLWKVLHNAYAENQPAPRKPEPAIEEPEEGGGGSEGGEARDPNTYTVKELENPRTFAEYIRDLAGKYWKEQKGIGKDADPWQNRIAVQFLRKTAQNVYTKLVDAITYSRSRDTAYRAIQKMDSIPTVAGLVSQMAYVGEIIHARHIREKKQELCEKLENLLKTAFGATGRFKVDKEELKRKVTAEMELRARYMRHAMWLTPDAASEEAGELSRALTAMATKYDEAERDLEQSRIYVETIRKLNILREFGGLKYKSVGEIEQALAWWEEQAAGSSAEIIKAFEDREERTKTAAAILAKAFFNPKMKHKIDKGFRQGMNNYLTAHMGFASLLQDMCRFASEKDRAEAYRIIDYLGREIQKAGDRSAAEMRRHGEDFHKAVEQIYGMPFKKVMAAMNREAPEFAPFMGTKGGHPIMPTKGRAMQLLVSLRQGARKDSNYYENVKHWKREGQAAQIADLLTPQDMNMLKWIGQWYEVNRQELSDVCEALFGIGVYSEAYNYFPVRMQLQKQGLEKVEGVAWTIFPKALTPRIRNLRDFDTETDIFALWASRMEEASQWKGHAKLGLELRGIFGRSELQEVVAANHGSRVNSLMLGFVTDILAGHGAYDRTTSGIEWWSDQIRGWTALCALGGNVGVTFKQTTSIPAFGFEIGLVKTARYTVTAFTPAGMEAMRRIFASEQRKTRWQVGNTEAVKNALAKSDAGWFKRAMQASMITNKVGDIVPGLVVGQGIYRDCLAQGMSEENAMAQTWMLIERTQQSGRMENQTSVQRRNRLGRMLYQFLTTQQQYLQYEVRAIRQAVADPSLKNAAQVANTILLNHLILSSLYYWMGELYKAMLGSEPPKDQIADWVVTCLLGPFASLYVLGFGCKVTLDRFLKGSWTTKGEDIMPMESFIKNTINDAGRVVEAIFEEDKTTDDLIEELGRLAAGMNPVVRDIRRVIKNTEE